MTTTWRNYTEGKEWGQHTVVGNLQISYDFYSPQLNNRRHILVHLPPSYGKGDGRYPVIYMQDGQNLFDDHASFAGEWRVDETMEQLSRQGIEAIIVGIPNMGAERINEYNPFRNVHHRDGHHRDGHHRDGHHRDGRGDLYMAFIAQTLKPAIDRDFRTLPDRMHTGLMGSSMGGLIALYGFFSYPDLFGLAGVMSPSLWFARESILDYVEAAPYSPGRIYLDAGTREISGAAADYHVWRARSRNYYAKVRRLKRILVRKGYRPIHELLHFEERDARHQEAAWARRLPRAFAFLLGGTQDEGQTTNGE
jgi:predicted alpha/beta superfamily hydrolase